jgi:tyrosine-protein kinase Etk/Wzc
MEQGNHYGEISILGHLKVIRGNWKFICLVAAAAFAVSAAIGFLLPKTYMSTASILPPQQDSPMNSSFLSQLPAGIGPSLLGVKSPADLWVGILKNDSVREPIINRFGLMAVYDAKTIDDAKRVLDTRVGIKKGKEDIISVSVEDTDAVRAADMANAFVDELDKINRDMSMTSGRRTRVFLEKRLAESLENMRVAEEALRAFQEKNRAIKLDDQAKAVIESIGTIKGQIMAKEVELQSLLSYATPENPQVRMLQAELNSMKRQLRASGSGAGLDSDVFIPTERMPSLGTQYVRLARDAKVQQTIYEMLVQQYEVAKIQEVKDSPTVQVLYAAKPAQKKFKPKISMIVMVSTLSAILLAVLYTLFREHSASHALRPGQPVN